MGSSSGTKAKIIDPTVGGLVWVRRRNGSWWPGRIMSIDELSEDSLISPRLGTPVKLLGRDDASVDWYNLEKSRRVKAFRCGEYDDCIAKAQTAASSSSKKAVKYARREDAILHALELESALLSRVSPDSNLEAAISSDEKLSSKESPTVSCSVEEKKDVEKEEEESGSLEDNSSSAQELSQSAVSFEELNHVNGATTQGRRRRTPNDSEDDGTEGVKRMRGLEDLGIGVVSSLKRKRSQVAHVHEFLKRKNRRRPLTKVLESTSIVSVPITCEPQVASTSKASAPDSNESKRNISTVLHNSDTTGVSVDNESSLNLSDHASDAPIVNLKQKENEISSRLGLTENDSSGKLFEVPFVGEDKQARGFVPVLAHSANQKTEVDADISQVETKCQIKEEHKEYVSTCLGAADINISQTIEKGSSKWQSKGKRNSRQINKHKRRESRNCMAMDETSFIFGWNRNASHKVSNSSLPANSSKLIPDSSQTQPPQRSLPYRQSRFTLNPKYEASEFPISFDPDSSLFDVTLEVKTGHPQHVPYISLMSKLNCRPIIGHPITVEPLKEEGLSNLLAVDYETGQICSKPKPNRVGGSSKRPKKSLKSKKNGSLSKKTRKLSSLTGSQKRNQEEKKPVLEKFSGQPVIACVPLKVVFSRLNASFNSSMRSSSKPFN
ncbi:uncharacterized protein At1g51745-like [Impatiens glandulifera]|uniref:uncharacterized protein At1g51745-like n=1 Tax=Impatiens glandulifera TaxID=253017 RepID=UPI001FB123F7|nr:uncharacterized protein At1g51745-like [Impatiens glandulifera]XP_047341187.1 uncharacterized protein At1g51745-like [Impatiens glandulifera]XP_047341188.1 uncharacterized protein At1g51745-like [Impatiens glandulifera]